MRVILKSLSWAVVSGLIIGTTAYLGTGCIRGAIVTAIVSALLKTPAYTVHELIWDRRKCVEI